MLIIPKKKKKIVVTISWDDVYNIHGAVPDQGWALNNYSSNDCFHPDIKRGLKGCPTEK